MLRSGRLDLVVENPEQRVVGRNRGPEESRGLWGVRRKTEFGNEQEV